MANDQKRPGGEFAGAYESIAAAAPKRRKSYGYGGDYPAHSTAELISDSMSNSIDDATREKLEAEIARRQAKGIKS